MKMNETYRMGILLSILLIFGLTKSDNPGSELHPLYRPDYSHKRVVFLDGNAQMRKASDLGNGDEFDLKAKHMKAISDKQINAKQDNDKEDTTEKQFEFPENLFEKTSRNKRMSFPSDMQETLKMLKEKELEKEKQQMPEPEKPVEEKDTKFDRFLMDEGSVQKIMDATQSFEVEDMIKEAKDKITKKETNHHIKYKGIDDLLNKKVDSNSDLKLKEFQTKMRAMIQENKDSLTSNQIHLI